jgi:hypothetical protein
MLMCIMDLWTSVNVNVYYGLVNLYDYCGCNYGNIEINFKQVQAYLRRPRAKPS